LRVDDIQNGASALRSFLPRSTLNSQAQIRHAPSVSTLPANDTVSTGTAERRPG